MRDGFADADGPIPHREDRESRPLEVRLPADGRLGLVADGSDTGCRNMAAEVTGTDAGHLAWIIRAGGGGEEIDCKARRLIAEFGSLGAVLAAPDARLEVTVDGGEAVSREIRRFNEAASYVLLSRVVDRPVLSCWSQVIDYLSFGMSHRTHERFRVLHLDAGNRLIRDELMSEGGGERTPVSVRSVVSHAMEFGSASLILVHNHPSGDPSPSAADIELTARIVHLARGLDIEVIDHLIVGTGQVFSFRGAELLT
jgi:DNA repair protein RadC